jgi:hypothetical protein
MPRNARIDFNINSIIDSQPPVRSGGGNDVQIEPSASRVSPAERAVHRLTFKLGMSIYFCLQIK